MKKKSLLLLLITIAILAGGAAVLGINQISKSSYPGIPSSIKEDLNFVVFYPPKNLGITIDKKTYKFDTTEKLFTYKASGKYGNLILSEQAAPENFADFPQLVDKFAESLQTTTRFDASQGKVMIAYPEELKGQQAGILYGKGTLMFIRPDKPLTEDEWRKLFNALEIEK